MLNKKCLWLFALSAVAMAETVIGTTAIARDNGGKLLPRFVNGFTAFYDRDGQTVDLFDQSGLFRSHVLLALPGTAKFVIVDVTVNKSGGLAVSGTAVSNDGVHFTPVIVWVRPEGQVEKVIRTAPYAASRIRFTPDGHLWALGLVTDANGKPEAAEYDLLREYDAQGVLIRTVLPKSTFADVKGHPSSGAFLVSNQDRIGVYSPFSGTYTELDYGGAIAGRWQMPAISKTTGAGLTSTGDFYISAFDNSKGSISAKAAAYRLDRAAATLVPIDLPSLESPSKLMSLLGAEESNLIFYTHPVAITRIAVQH